MLRGYAAFVAICFLCLRANSAVIVPTASGFTSGERHVLESAIDYWEQLISDPLTLHISFSKESFSGDLLGLSSGFAASSNGLPLGASIQIDDRKGFG